LVLLPFIVKGEFQVQGIPNGHKLIEDQENKAIHEDNQV